jgi:endonuclease/exonuclease/phosphatase (EEP) superfamily protein YafD
MDKHFIIEQDLRNIYYNPSIDYKSVEKLYRKAKEDGLDLSWTTIPNTAVY